MPRRHSPCVLAAGLLVLAFAARAEDAGHGPDAGEADGRAWTDYPHACLGAHDCPRRDEGTGLVFVLPRGWVADAPLAGPLTTGAAGGDGPVQVDFLQAGGNLQTLVLNPRQWLAGNGPCVATRAGALCHWRDADQADDPAVADAMALLQRSLATGTLLRRCGADASCGFDDAGRGLAGELPPGWAVERPRRTADGRPATWFFAVDEGGNFKLLGLNQAGGDACTDTAAGDRLCEFTPYIDTAEVARIAGALRLTEPSPPRPGR